MGFLPTGNLDARTIKDLNAPATDRHVDLVIANMERWRWYPRDLGADHVIVNQPEFMLKVMHNGSQIWTTKVVIGDTAPNKQTPLLSETLKTITVNPTWNVPPSIVYGEYLPALAEGPVGPAAHGLERHLRPRRQRRSHLAASRGRQCAGDAFVSTSPTGFSSISTTRTRVSCLRTTCVRKATVACACRILRNMPSFS